MQSQTHYQSYLEEKLIYGALIWTYPVYAVGGLYITGSALAWVILAIVGLRAFVDGVNPFSKAPLIVWCWIAGMLVMLVSLWIAHGNWSLGLTQTIKSTVGWAKGWALLGLFVLLGAVVKIDATKLIRAVCMVSKWSGIFAIVTIVLYVIGAPGQLFISPLKVLGGSGDNFFMVSLYGVNPETGAGRWQFFAPWAPAAGFMSCIYVLFCLQEQDKYWRNWGIAGCICMALLSQSRAGWAIFILIIPTFLFTKHLTNPRLLFVLGIILPICLVLGEPVYEWLTDTFQQIKEARPASTRVRAALENLALQRWQAEAPIWGHGVVESGPKLVEFMPIGSHHTWFGLLFVKGVVGLLALAIPMLVTMAYLLVFAFHQQQARAALCMLLVFTCYSFFENLEILAYLYWPALIWIGMAIRSTVQRGVHYE